MTLHVVGKEMSDAPRPSPAPAMAPASPGMDAATSLDPLIAALSRAADRLGPGAAPGPRPETAG